MCMNDAVLSIAVCNPALVVKGVLESFQSSTIDILCCLVYSVEFLISSESDKVETTN